MKETDYAIFLHRIHYSESSLIATFYTRQSGIRTFLFQGGKKKSTVLFPLSLCELTFYMRADSELAKLTEARAAVMLPSLVTDPMKATIAFFLADVLRKCLKSEEKDAFLFDFLQKTIQELDHTHELSFFVLKFLTDLTNYLGIEPQIETQDPRYFYLENGEISHDWHSGEIVAQGETIPLLVQLFTHQLPAHYPQKIKAEALAIMMHYYKIHIPGFDVEQSLEIIREILYS